MEERMKITLKKELLILRNLILKVIVISTFLYFINLSMWVNIIVITLITFPTIYLHLEYSYIDRYKTIVFKNGDFFLQINNDKFDLSSTNKIVIRGSVALTRNVIPLVISPNYYNVIFISKEFGEISVSSLVNPNLKNIILERFDNEIINYDYFLLY